jgi:phosphoglycolate phosphatase-like HAD superfamily hydrolase
VIRAAVFDFDGVIAESTDIKTEAFRQLFDGDERAVEYHEANMGVSRYDKFRHITTEILGRPYTAEDERRLGERFSELAVDEVVRCPFVAGAPELLARLAEELPLFVASATPEEEVREIVALRGLEALFDGVYGTPATKGEILRRILSERGLDRSAVVMVGDARSDLNGAREAGVRFVGRVPDGAPDPFAEEHVPVVSDLSELDRRWAELFG